MAEMYQTPSKGYSQRFAEAYKQAKDFNAQRMFPANGTKVYNEALQKTRDGLAMDTIPQNSFGYNEKGNQSKLASAYNYASSQLPNGAWMGSIASTPDSIKNNTVTNAPSSLVYKNPKEPSVVNTPYKPSSQNSYITDMIARYKKGLGVGDSADLSKIEADAKAKGYYDALMSGVKSGMGVSSPSNDYINGMIARYTKGLGTADSADLSKIEADANAKGYYDTLMNGVKTNMTPKNQTTPETKSDSDVILDNTDKPPSEPTDKTATTPSSSTDSAVSNALKSQVEALQNQLTSDLEGNNIKSFLDMRKAYRDAAKRGMDNSGVMGLIDLNLMNKANADNQRAKTAIADKLSKVTSSFATDSAKNQLEYDKMANDLKIAEAKNQVARDIASGKYQSGDLKTLLGALNDVYSTNSNSGYIDKGIYTMLLSKLGEGLGAENLTTKDISGNFDSMLNTPTASGILKQAQADKIYMDGTGYVYVGGQPVKVNGKPYQTLDREKFNAEVQKVNKELEIKSKNADTKRITANLNADNAAIKINQLNAKINNNLANATFKGGTAMQAAYEAKAMGLRSQADFWTKVIENKESAPEDRKKAMDALAGTPERAGIMGQMESLNTLMENNATFTNSVVGGYATDMNKNKIPVK